MKPQPKMSSKIVTPDNIDWKKIYDDLLPRVYHFFCYKTGDPLLAEELTATTFEKAWKGREHYDHELSKFQSWLYGIAKKVAADHFRRHKTEISLDAETAISSQNVEKDVETNLNFERLAGLLNSISERERSLIALKYGAELNNREIARLTGLSETNLGTILFRAVSRLREEWRQ
jgi:RNA polymerase sigma-70 factor (ECF subfamily)